MDIGRREKNGISKLTTELMLYRLLYLDWLERFTLTNENDEQRDSGVSFREIRLFIAASLRTLMRYTGELQACGAVEKIRVNKKQERIVATFGEIQPPEKQDTVCGDAHMHKLQRTARVMKKHLDWRWTHTDWYGYDREHMIRFFSSPHEAEEWYEGQFPDQRIDCRTMQRDMHAVREALKETERIEERNLYEES